MKKGIDLSKWNGSINFTAVKGDGIDFVLLRDGYRFSQDPSFKGYAAACLNRGILIPGVYHFSYALTASEAKREAETAIKNLEEASLNSDTIVFFDYEYDSVDYAKHYGHKPTRKTCTELTKAFCDRVSELGYLPGIYYNVDFERNWYEDGFLKDYPGWIADWRTSASHEDVLFHQYSNKGVVDGISGFVDMDYMHEVKMEVKPVNEAERVAKEVLAGKWGNGLVRRIRLSNAGYNYAEIQAEVNKLLGL